MNVQQQSLLFLHCSVLLFGGTALFSKLIGLPALDITVYRTGVAAMVLFILLTIQKKQSRFSQLERLWNCSTFRCCSRYPLGYLFCKYANGRGNYRYYRFFHLPCYDGVFRTFIK